MRYTGIGLRDAMVVRNVSVARLFSSLLLLAIGLGALGAGTAAASPSNDNTYYVEMSCPEVGGIFTLAIVNPNSSARHIVGTNHLVVLASVVGDATFDGVPVTIDSSPSEQRFEHQDLTTCYVNDSFVLPKSGVLVTVDVTVQALLTPRSQ